MNTNRIVRLELERLDKDYHVVDYMHIDDSRCFQPLEQSMYDFFPEDEPVPGHLLNGFEWKLREKLSAMFTAAGWEGDGEINCLFIPPCFTNCEDSACAPVFHVKQSSNGTSWLAIPKDLKFEIPKPFIAGKRQRTDIELYHLVDLLGIRILLLLARETGVSPCIREVGEIIGVDPKRCRARIVDLVALGLVAVSDDPVDRRRSIPDITDLGESFLEELKKTIEREQS